MPVRSPPPISRPPHSTALPPLRGIKHRPLCRTCGTAELLLDARASRAPAFLRLRPRLRNGPAEGPPAFRRRRSIRHESHPQCLAGSLSRSRPAEAGHDRRHALLVGGIRAVVSEHVQGEVANTLDRVLETIRLDRAHFVSSRRIGTTDVPSNSAFMPWSTIRQLPSECSSSRWDRLFCSVTERCVCAPWSLSSIVTR